ncbi:MAG: AAA family ATPase [Dysgonamonadaceae bacterium]|jgi:SpoVK/Ycf46/Vps4 family AAA+-type ATPase|nr:AAA family ATPase [Dysgonamonadaceae bacterium]
MEQIEKLREALLYSPDNVTLRKLLAEQLATHGYYEEAAVEYKIILKQEPDSKDVVVAFAQCYYKTGNYSMASVILESHLDKFNGYVPLLVLYTRVLLAEGNIQKAIEAYQSVLDAEPNFRDDELDRTLRVGNKLEFDEFEDDNIFVERPDISFADIGGMENVKKEIDLKIIAPMKFPELYAAYGKKAGGGILLYGPPGCGKTYLAKATAGQINSKFISVGISDILDMWIGNSEKNLHDIFETARRNKPCVLFFDEIDALGASRSDMRQTAGKQTINQFLSELDGLSSNNDDILVLGATNAPWHLDHAFRRPGRFDRIIFVSPPDEKSREEIFKIHLKGKPVENISFTNLAMMTDKFSGADIKAVIDQAIEEKLTEAMITGIPKPLTNKDIGRSVKKHVPTTQEWFTRARNYALYSNEAGQYDDILNYLKLKK